MPLNRATTLYRLGKVQQKLTQDLGREPTVEEIAGRTGIDPWFLRNLWEIAEAEARLSDIISSGCLRNAKSVSARRCRCQVSDSKPVPALGTIVA